MRPEGGRPIDPFSPQSPGRYADEWVEIVHSALHVPFDPATLIVQTPHFGLFRHDRRVRLSHRLRADQLDNDLTGLLVNELFDPGWLIGNAIFESVFTGIVRSTIDDPVRAWLSFYSNTLIGIRAEWTAETHSASHSTIAQFAPVYARAISLIPPGRVLDLGSCFGYLPLLLAQQRRHSVIASDIAEGSMRLTDTVARSWQLPLRTLVCDASTVPLPDRAVDTVTVLHLLEHLDPAQSRAVLREAIRLAAHRVIVAVPFEQTPDAAYGHVCCFDTATLIELGRATRRPFTVTEHHGGWLVVDAA